ncbi:uncharacterized protein LOC130252370 [Oenanthe melanoleuca]|uniref:uncharacterized protein LOC130252370 n=1 Tax=Oenanthe melanoleuca TaxID=2939378 RepID=UPI0024C1DC9B|nr:uncharacterized protein LOC130252370 [Oenanthe melanoleuca]
MKQLIALGNGCLCPAARGNIFEACPTDPGLCKHIQAITQIPVRSPFPAPLLIVLLFPNTLYLLFSPALCVKCRVQGLAAGAVPAWAPAGAARRSVAAHLWVQELVLLADQRIPTVLGIPTAAPRCAQPLLGRDRSAQTLPTLPRAETFPFPPAFTDSPAALMEHELPLLRCVHSIQQLHSWVIFLHWTFKYCKGRPSILKSPSTKTNISYLKCSKAVLPSSSCQMTVFPPLTSQPRGTGAGSTFTSRAAHLLPQHRLCLGRAIRLIGQALELRGRLCLGGADRVLPSSALLSRRSVKESKILVKCKRFNGESFPTWHSGSDRAVPRVPSGYSWHPVLGSGTSATEPPIPRDGTEGGLK